jgi:2-polyprenyl-3-methyl-5-hydroxy-6-metoxy-1,4-benzoquinol methylase
MDFMAEKTNLETISRRSIYASGIAAYGTKYCCSIFQRFLKPKSILELGPAEGLMTDILYPPSTCDNDYTDYTVVDGSETFIAQIKKKYPGINAVVSLFEDFKPSRKFDNIILGHVLEHVVDPVKILQICRIWLNEQGIILAAVPNKNSIHRQIGLKMGLLSALDDFSEKDKLHGHRRVFGVKSFQECFIKAGLNIVKQGGYWLKPFSDKQIEGLFKQSSDEIDVNNMIQSFMEIGEEHPDIAGEIYIIASR